MKIDLGRKSGGSGELAGPIKSPPSVYYPSLHIDKEPDEFPDYDVGDVIKAVVELKVTSLNIRKEPNGNANKSCGFDVLSIDLKEPMKKKNDDDIEEGLKDEMEAGDPTQDDD